MSECHACCKKIDKIKESDHVMMSKARAPLIYFHKDCFIEMAGVEMHDELPSPMTFGDPSPAVQKMIDHDDAVIMQKLLDDVDDL